ncbi:uncharacterized protein BDZ99DRAFT_7341 [Mytilinidion resinicola]|uniref:Uncharacterized protein n=1 Tax=Mytilinidion resinicola TaxID=574789 RepID=A0A6A6Z7K4_9PEZI|nr:uncharacterized protein BDZ99DRAFT_7341 [Mytilinidion resinicola]KAF2817020.1 hypothetical protein BDZ99DRAFT_7341 [Mytilinidion resinicola]
MVVCTFEGNSDMYGLGIRLGFYLQWFGAIFAAWIARGEVKGLWFANDFFVAATFLALVIQVSRNVQSLQVVEVYIILLLMFGAYLYAAPVYIWRFFTRRNPYWDPTRWPIVQKSALHSNLRLLLEFAVLGLQFWFWFGRVQDLKGEECDQFGFFFAKIRLNNTGFVVINILLYFMLATICLLLVFVKMVSMLGYLKDLNAYEDDPSEDVERRIQVLRNLNSLINIIVATIITAATELTIHWNNITGVNSLAAAGQTILFVIGLGAVIRVFYVYLFHDEQRDDENDDGQHPHDGYRPKGPINFDLPPRAAAPQGGRPSRTAVRQETVSDSGARRERRRGQGSSSGPQKAFVEEDIVEMDWERQGWVRRHPSRR